VPHILAVPFHHEVVKGESGAKRRKGIRPLIPLNMSLLDTVLNIFFPKNFTCDLCGAEVFDRSNLCKSCAESVHYNNGETCPKCGRKTNNSSGLCLECKELAPLYDKAYSAFVYEAGVKTLIGRFKNGKAYLAEFFAEKMYAATGDIPDAQAVCYVPMTKKSMHKRGYNQAQLLAERYGKLSKLPVLNGALVKVKETPPQKSLTRMDREENLRGCFKADFKLVKGKNIILIDDVMTTGATADVAVRQLKRRGAAKVYFVTTASVEYKSPLT